MSVLLILHLERLKVKELYIGTQKHNRNKLKFNETLSGVLLSVLF